jgi:hypothetical protein
MHYGIFSYFYNKMTNHKSKKSKKYTKSKPKNKQLIQGFTKKKSYKPRMRRNIKISNKKVYDINIKLGKLDNSIGTETIGSYIESRK